MSSNFKVEVLGLDKMKESTKEITKAAQKLVGDALYKVANKVRSEAITSIARGSHSGAVYGKHQASAPGETPATDTGNLVSNIKVEFDRSTLTAVVRANTPYAARLEFGDSGKTPGDAFIAARPFMRPAVEKVSPELIEDITKAWSEAAKAGE